MSEFEPDTLVLATVVVAPILIPSVQYREGRSITDCFLWVCRRLHWGLLVKRLAKTDGRHPNEGINVVVGSGPAVAVEMARRQITTQSSAQKIK
jgi:hypothetical protein